ncbi:MAG TPA: hypothetical protein VFQ13_15345, partial [Anaerolineales bacterium]|nr:hypothetical protein [Anaerolineales bacterium]
MQSAKRIGRLRAWFSGLTLFVLVCAFLGWGIRELLFPPTDACAIERTGKRSPLDSSQVYPIKNNIELIGHVGGEAESVFVRGNIAFVKLGLELAAFDIQNPSDPRRVGYILMGGDLIHVDADGNNAYLYSSGDLSGLWKIDTADPTQMSAAHIYDPIFYVASIRMLGEQAYITTQTCEYMTFIEGSIKTRCDDALHIVDTANPDAPVKCYQGWLDDAVRSFAVSNAPELITASKTVRQGNYKYVAEEKNGFKVYDVSNPLQPAEVGS